MAEHNYEYKSNSHRSKETQLEKSQEKRVDKVVTTQVKTRKKNNIRKLADTFTSPDAANVGSYVWGDVLVPSIKKALDDIVTNGIRMILYGETTSRSKTSNVSYRNYYDRRDDRTQYSSTARTTRRFDYDDLIFANRGEAEDVLDRMDETVGRYGFVTVADMYDMADLTAPYTSNKYGWTSIRTAEVTRVREGYIIKLPKALPIE